MILSKFIVKVPIHLVQWNTNQYPILNPDAVDGGRAEMPDHIKEIVARNWDMYSLVC